MTNLALHLVISGKIVACIDWVNKFVIPVGLLHACVLQ